MAISKHWMQIDATACVKSFLSCIEIKYRISIYTLNYSFLRPRRVEKKTILLAFKNIGTATKRKIFPI